MAKFGIGQPVRRVEDRRFLTGTGRYLDDIRPPGTVHAVLLRSPHAHAAIRALDAAPARAAPGVLAVLTGAEVEADGLGPLVTAAGLPGIVSTPRPILARDRVRFVGEGVALIVAEAQSAARDAAELIEVDYDPLPLTVDPAGALEPGAPRVWDDAPGNLAFTWESGDARKTADAFARAARVVSIDLVNNRIVSNPMEERGAIGLFDPASGRYTVYTSTQGVHLVRKLLAKSILNVPEEHIHVVAPDVGGGFGTKIFVYPEDALVAWASRKVGRPVKWVSERAEGFVSDVHGRDHVSHAELALDEEGRFLGLKVDTVANMGAYLSLYGPAVPTVIGAPLLAGIYATPAIHVRVRGALTNTVPVDAYRGAGRPESAYLIERLVDKVGRETGLGPAEIRRRNAIPPERMPYTTPLGETYDSGEFVALMEEAMRQADWDGFPSRRKESEAKGRLRGIGMATYIESCGGGGDEEAQIRFEKEGEVTVLIGTQSTGQGHQTAYAQIAAEGLGVPFEAVTVVQGDSDRIAFGRGTGGSRSIPVGGAALGATVDRVVEKGRALAANRLEAAEADIEFTDGRFTIVGTDRSVGLFELAREPGADGKGSALDSAERFKPPASTYPNGCHVCEVEIDPDTGETAVVRYTVVDDFGIVLNPLLLEGQVHGGIAQGIGQALLERTAYDPESGQLLSATFMDYAMPHADHVPSIAFSTRNVRCRTNPMGVKGAGEAGAIGAPPAVINAVVDALAPRGIDHIDMPATPQAVWQALHRNR